MRSQEAAVEANSRAQIMNELRQRRNEATRTELRNPTTELDSAASNSNTADNNQARRSPTFIRLRSPTSSRFHFDLLDDDLLNDNGAIIITTVTFLIFLT